MTVPTAEEKLHVMALVGFACTNAAFRESFFADPVATARKIFTSLTPYEENRVTGIAAAPYADERRAAMATVESRLGCPEYPCPEPLEESSAKH